MKNFYFLAFLSLQIFAAALLHGATVDESRTSAARFRIVLNDGSNIQAQTATNHLVFVPKISGEKMSIRWSRIKSITIQAKNEAFGVSFLNGDQLTGVWLDESIPIQTGFGAVRIPYDEISIIDEIKANPERVNIALGKNVTGQDGASHGQGLAKHLTDGDYSTHTKPPASNFSYRIDLRDKDRTSFAVNELRINWKYFGDRFLGIPNPDGNGWAQGSWPGEYVTSYKIEYRKSGAENWICFHECSGRPVAEKTDRVTVLKSATERQGASSDVITTIHDLGLSNVAEIRISANGSHWIGLYELEVYEK
jgi:hypothetical protein